MLPINPNGRGRISAACTFACVPATARARARAHVRALTYTTAPANVVRRAGINRGSSRSRRVKAAAACGISREGDRPLPPLTPRERDPEKTSVVPRVYHASLVFHGRRLTIRLELVSGDHCR